MSRKRQNITLPADLILDIRISANAKIVYAILKMFRQNIVKVNLPPFPSSAVNDRLGSITITHGEIIERSGLSLHTVIKSLNRLETAGWIIQERSLGSANRYYFTTPIG